MAARKKVLPSTGQEEKALPDVKQPDIELPSAEQASRELPSPSQGRPELPKVGDVENTLIIGGEMVTIKPTKVKYQRNKTALFYKVLAMYPLPEVLAMQEGAFGDDRDGDKAVMDWLIAVFDDEDFVLKNYEEMDTGTIEQLLTIFKRVNKIDDKEEKLKNLQGAGNRH